jgi:hypothetical protein
MPAEVFDNDDADYVRWLTTNPNGFVVNALRSLASHYMVLHRASCPHISVPSHEVGEGGFTERQYIKVAAPEIESLRQWVSEHGRADRTFSNECSHCRPTS